MRFRRKRYMTKSSLSFPQPFPEPVVQIGITGAAEAAERELQKQAAGAADYTLYAARWNGEVMGNTMKWMLAAALVVGGLGLSAVPANAAQIGFYIGTGPAAYIPPYPGPGYAWIAGYYAGGYWIPGRWAFVGYGSQYYGNRYYGDRDDHYRDRGDSYRDRDWNRGGDRERDRGWERGRDRGRDHGGRRGDGGDRR